MPAPRCSRPCSGGGASAPWTPLHGRSASRGNPPWCFPLPVVRWSRGSHQGERRVGAGTAGGGDGTNRYQPCPRPISGPTAAVSAPGLLECLSTHGKTLQHTRGGYRRCRSHSCFYNVLGSTGQTQRPTVGGEPGHTRRWATTKVAAHLCRGQWWGGNQDFLVSAPPLPETLVHPYPCSLAASVASGAAHWASPRCH